MKKPKSGVSDPVKDAALIAGCRKGERRAQVALYQQYKDWVFNIALRMTNQQQEAEDISQKVFLQIFRKIASFRGDAALSSWIYRMTVNICINHFRKEKKRKEHISNELSAVGEQGTSGLQSRNEGFNLAPHLKAAIRALPAGYRMVFVLHDIEGHKHEEIARMLKISSGTSKSQLHKARKELRTYLEPFIEIHSTL